jgi:hypothetical protein
MKASSLILDGKMPSSSDNVLKKHAHIVYAALIWMTDHLIILAPRHCQTRALEQFSEMTLLGPFIFQLRCHHLHPPLSRSGCRCPSTAHIIRRVKLSISAEGLPARVRIPVPPSAASRLLYELLDRVRLGFLVVSQFRIACNFLHLDRGRSSK